MNQESFFEIGRAKVDITPPARGQMLLGWWDPQARARSVAVPIFIRCLRVRDPAGKSLAFFQLDLCYVSENLHRALLDRILSDPSSIASGIRRDGLFFSATHTHSAPGGFCDEAVYQIGSLGVDDAWIVFLAESALRALRDAGSEAIAARMITTRARLDPKRNIAYNRALRAQAENPDVPLGPDWVDGTWREFPVWRFERISDDPLRSTAPLAVVSFFGLHGTCIHQDRRVIHPDHKGLSSTRTEERFRTSEPGFIALYLQGAGGDVSPNFREYPGLPWYRGEYRDDYESVEWVADRQSEAVENAMTGGGDDARIAIAREGVDTGTARVDFFDPAELAAGRVGPAVGSSTLFGTREGHGLGFEKIFARFLRWYTRDAKTTEEQTRIHHPKKIVVDGALRRLTLFKLDGRFRVPPAFLHPMFAVMRGWREAGIHTTIPLLPLTQEITLARLGDRFVLACPGEFTLVAAHRMKLAVARGLTEAGLATDASEVTFLGYTNGYGGYVTTPEEYSVQLYEGASTLYGRETLNAYRARALALARELGERLSRTRPDSGTIRSSESNRRE